MDYSNSYNTGYGPQRKAELTINDEQVDAEYLPDGDYGPHEAGSSFEADAFGSFTGYTPEQIKRIDSGDIYVNEFNEYSEAPAGSPNPIGMFDFGFGSVAGKMGRAEALAHNKKVDGLYTEGISKLKAKYSDPKLSKIENLRAIQQNSDYRAERDKLIVAVDSSFVDDTGDLDTWMGDSKSLPPLYHGTGADITEFDPSKNIRSTHNIEGIYTTINPEDAGQYANDTMSGNVMPLVGKNTNLVDVHNTSISLEQAKKFGVPEYKLHELKETRGYNLGAVLRASGLTNKENTRLLESMGASGLRDGGHYIFFNPNDLKSRYNRGAYSLMDNDVMKSSGIAGAAALGASQSEE